VEIQADRMNAAQPAARAVQFQRRNPRLDEWLKDYPAEMVGDQLHQSIELMEQYSIELTVGLLDELDLLGRMDDWISPNELNRRAGFQPSFTPALGWLLERVVETNLIQVGPNGMEPVYRRTGRPSSGDRSRIRELAIEIDARNASTLNLLDHAAGVYPVVARGEQSAENCLFGPKGIALWLDYFNNDNLTYAVNNWVAAVLAAKRLASMPRFRILEVGAGAGSGSQALLGQLEQVGLLSRIERYLITEPNAYFRRRAQRELAALYPTVPLEWGTLDLNTRWANQISSAGEFDLVYGVNVMHVSKNLLFSLTEAASVLARNGWMVIGECVRPFANQPIYPEFMFQNLESFRDVQIDPLLRPRPGFLSPEQWRAALNRAGFNGCEIAPDIEQIRRIYPHFFTTAIAGQKADLTNVAAVTGS
jgi:SAM-dependent methyltransferase